MTVLETDPFDAGLALAAPGVLREFNAAGVLDAADVHVALRLAALAGEADEDVALAAALAVRGPRLGHVYVDIATVRDTTNVESEDVDLAALPWPDATAWLDRLAASPLVAVGEGDDAAIRPLRLVDTALYLDRYWREERRVASDLLALAGAPPGDVDEQALDDGLARVFAGQPDERQMQAAAIAVRRRFTVVAGGPGTGKTTTVARIVALLAEQDPDTLVALAAPTAKAAARLSEAVHEEAQGLDVPAPIRARLLDVEASTLHRLLGWRPDSHSRFRHHRANRLPHDVVIVDETSMVSLSMMARLAEAVRPTARLILVGDPGQLASIEAGAVLGDIVGPAAGAPSGSPVGEGIVILEHVHRFGEGIAEVADAIRQGDADRVIKTLADAPEGVTWIDADVAGVPAETLAPIRDGAVTAGRTLVEAGRAGDARRALEALGTFRVLCAHRRGPHGVATWMDRIERWLAAELPDFATEGDWYAGRPLLMTENDYGLRLFNGDTGVVVASGADGVAAAFERRGEIVEYSPSRLEAIETVYAMTIHKSQGSQFDTAAVLLPDVTSQILTRQLLYTAVTRARRQLILVGAEDTIREAASRPVARASGLGWRLWER